MGKELSIQLFFVLVILCGVVGCSTPESRLRERPEAFSNMADNLRSAALKGEIQKGMGADAVYVALGPPARITSNIKDGKKVDLWIYTRVESEEISGLQGGGESFDPHAPTYRRYSPIKLTHPRDDFEVQFEDGKVVNWRDL